MAIEQDIQNKLVENFNFLDGKVNIPRPRRIFLEVENNIFTQVLEYSMKTLNFSILCTITGLDEGERFGVIYHLANTQGVVLSIKVTIPREKPELNTITAYFANAQIYERELMDLFGIKVQGLPAGNRYPLSDDWPKDVFPLRKDWKPTPKNK